MDDYTIQLKYNENAEKTFILVRKRFRKRSNIQDVISCITIYFVHFSCTVDRVEILSVVYDIQYIMNGKNLWSITLNFMHL